MLNRERCLGRHSNCLRGCFQCDGLVDVNEVKKLDEPTKGDRQRRAFTLPEGLARAKGNTKILISPATKKHTLKHCEICSHLLRANVESTQSDSRKWLY
jgi:hypothetical protein